MLVSMSFIIFRFVSPIISAKLLHIPFKEVLKNLSALKMFFIMVVLTRLALINVPCTVGEDLGQQVLSSRQWIEGESIGPNMLASPERGDLSVNEQNWMVRPPGGAWLPLPGLLLGFSLGNSLHISLFILSVAFGAGWLKLAHILSLPKHSLLLLAMLLAFMSSLGSLSLSTASVFTSATFPWLLIWSLYLSDQWNLTEQKLKIHFLSLLFFLTIGFHAFFKLSSLLTVSAIALIPFVIHITKFRKINFMTCRRAILGLTLFLLPYFLVSKLNQNFTGISSDELYSQQDYNAQHELWGKYFTESTRGGMLAISLIASTGYATPVQDLAHGFRDLLLQFENYSSTLHSHGINPRILGCCILAIPFTLILFIALWKIKDSLNNKELILYSTLFIVPFLGFALISHSHGYNYLIYHAYTKEFAVIFLIFALSYLIHVREIVKKKFIGNILMTFFVVLPIVSYGKNYCSTFFGSNTETYSSQYEIQQGFGPSKFSESLQLILSDSTSSLDICLFLCAGDQGDHFLRTPMRALSLHFAKGNIMHFPSLKTSRPMRVYCLFDPLLSNDSSFIQSVIEKFPVSAKSTRLDSLTWKVELKGFNQ